MEILVESQNTGLYFETTTRFFLVITIEEAGGGGGASCVSSALKPVSASPVEDAGPNANLGVPGATCSEVELMSRCRSPDWRAAAQGVQSISSTPALVGPQALLLPRHPLC